MEAIEEIKKGRKTLKIFVDESPSSPREWNNLGKFVLNHKRYNLPCEIPINLEYYGYDGNKIKEALKNEYDGEIVLKVRCYDHSGFSISISNNYPYNCRWDSGDVGFIVVTKKDLINNYGKINKNTIAKALEVIKAEIKIYNDYLNGNVYGYKVVTFKTCKECKNVEEVEKSSCWGFYGSDGIKQIKEEEGFN